VRMTDPAFFEEHFVHKNVEITCLERKNEHQQMEAPTAQAPVRVRMRASDSDTWFQWEKDVGVNVVAAGHGTCVGREGKYVPGRVYLDANEPKYVTKLLKAEKRASKSRKGMWSDRPLTNGEKLSRVGRVLQRMGIRRLMAWVKSLNPLAKK
jgi:hypothetical protein